VTANGVKTYFLVFADSNSGDRDGPLDSDLRSGLGDCNVPDMADLTMLLVGGVLMPVPSGLHGKQAHGKDQGYGQQSYGYSLGHYQL
jgi:hypothetical protein